MQADIGAMGLLQMKIATIAALSLAAERLMEIVRGLLWFTYNSDVRTCTSAEVCKKTVEQDKARVAKVNLVSLATGVIRRWSRTAWAFSPTLPAAGGRCLCLECSPVPAPVSGAQCCPAFSG